MAKAKPDGELKHRLVQDLRCSRVNELTKLEERQVLPRGEDHAADLAFAADWSPCWAKGGSALIPDFTDAFMSVPLLPAEMRYSCTLSHLPIARRRAALHPTEPCSGKVLVWRVMGFGGKAYPLVFARVSGVVVRLSQAAVQFCHADLRGLMGQTYVDDPAFTTSGSPVACDYATNNLILFWLLLGIGLSWRKGGYFLHGVDHHWIGIHFQ